MGQKSPRAFQRFKRDGGVQGEEGFYEREILQQTVCTLPPPSSRRRETFAVITQLKLEATRALLSVLSSKKEKEEKKERKKEKEKGKGRGGGRRETRDLSLVAY